MKEMNQGFFANSAFIDEKGATFQKGIFTTCKNREGENVLLGQYKLKKLITIKLKKQCITIMQY